MFHKRKVIPHILDYIIPVDCCRKNYPLLILQLMTSHPILDFFK